MGIEKNKDKEGAKRILEVVPKTMRTLRSEFRSCTKFNLTVPQFRILIHLSRKTSTNNELAESQGVSVPAMSRMVEGLVKRDFIDRGENPKDRRQNLLILTQLGKETVEESRSTVQKTMAKRISALKPEPKKALIEGLKILDGLFS